MKTLLTAVATALLLATTLPAGATSPAKPPRRVSVTPVLTGDPAAVLSEPLASAKPMAGAAATVTPMVVLCAWTPVPVPFTVSVYEPGATAPVVVTDTDAVVTLAPRVAGETVAVMPAGAPLIASATSPAKPPVRAAVMVLVALWPATRLSAAGAALKPNAGVAAAATVSVTVAVALLTPVPDAVTVMG